MKAFLVLWNITAFCGCLLAGFKATTILWGDEPLTAVFVALASLSMALHCAEDAVLAAVRQSD